MILRMHHLTNRFILLGILSAMISCDSLAVQSIRRPANDQ